MAHLFILCGRFPAAQVVDPGAHTCCEQRCKCHCQDCCLQFSSSVTSEILMRKRTLGLPGFAEYEFRYGPITGYPAGCPGSYHPSAMNGPATPDQARRENHTRVLTRRNEFCDRSDHKSDI
jgi:hypothetical protein